MPKDIDAVLRMMRRYYEEDEYPFIEADARAAALRLTGNNEFGSLWVAMAGDRVAGYLAVTLGFSLEYRGRDAFIDELFIAEEHRGQGLGREAIEIAEAWCRELGVNALHLEVERHREKAQKLYRLVGFEDHERHLMTKCLKY